MSTERNSENARWSEAQKLDFIERLAAHLANNGSVAGLFDRVVAKKLVLPDGVIDARDRFRQRCWR